MKRQRMMLCSIAGLVLSGIGFASLPVFAQQDEREVRVRAKIIMRDSNGNVIETDVDPSQISGLPGERRVMVFGDGTGGFFSSSEGPEGFSFSSSGNTSGSFGLMNINAQDGIFVIDPGRTYIYDLVKRSDVQSHLLITARQREALEKAEKDFNENIRKRMTQDAKGLAEEIRDKSPDELKEYLNERGKKLAETARKGETDREKTLTTVLNAKQIARLKQLDLQWRGSLALGVKPVSDDAQLTKEQTPKTQKLLQDYRKEMSKAMMEAMGVRRLASRSGQNDKGGETSVDGAAQERSGRTERNPRKEESPEERKARLAKLVKELEKTRKTLSDKALAELNEEQVSRWSEMTGPKFRFRTNTTL